MPDARFPVEVVRGVPVVAAPEEIDITNAEVLRSALLTASAAADGCGTLVVDMTRTRFCDSSGLHTLIAAHKRAGAEGREVLLVIPDTAVLRVFALTGMDRVIPNFTTLAEALAQTAATANGHRPERVDGDAATETSRGSLALDGELPGTLEGVPVVLGKFSTDTPDFPPNPSAEHSDHGPEGVENVLQSRRA